MDYPKLAGTNIEICTDLPPKLAIKHALFDFDGTVSMLRDGWQDVMIPLMLEHLYATPVEQQRMADLIARGVTAEIAAYQIKHELERSIIEYVDLLTGKETIFQMQRLSAEIQRRGGQPWSPLEYKKEYYRHLDPIVNARIVQLKQGQLTTEQLRVPQSIHFLEALQQRQVKLYLASGTDESYVKSEVTLLELTPLFNGGIWGAQDSYQSFNKALAIQTIVQQNHLAGHEILVMGDGCVELECARQYGGISIGVYTDEGNHYNMNKRKRERLIQAGAHLVMPDFAHFHDLIQYLFPPHSN